MKRMISVVMLALLALTVLVCPALAAGSMTEPLEITETTYNGEHQDWTEGPADDPAPETVAGLTGIDPKRVSILWTVDYATANYPVEITVTAPGTDKLPVYILEYVGGTWNVIGTGTGPTVIAQVSQGGTISVVTQTSAIKPEDGGNLPQKDTGAKAPKTGENVWLAATAVVTVIAIGGALAMTKRREH